MKLGELWEIRGERMILREEMDSEYVFQTRETRQWITKDELETLVQSGDASIVNHTPANQG